MAHVDTIHSVQSQNWHLRVYHALWTLYWACMLYYMLPVTNIVPFWRVSWIAKSKGSWVKYGSSSLQDFLGYAYVCREIIFRVVGKKEWLSLKEPLIFGMVHVALEWDKVHHRLDTALGQLGEGPKSIVSLVILFWQWIINLSVPALQYLATTAQEGNGACVGIDLASNWTQITEDRPKLVRVTCRMPCFKLLRKIFDNRVMEEVANVLCPDHKEGVCIMQPEVVRQFAFPCILIQWLYILVLKWFFEAFTWKGFFSYIAFDQFKGFLPSFLMLAAQVFLLYKYRRSFVGLHLILTLVFVTFGRTFFKTLGDSEHLFHATKVFGTVVHKSQHKHLLVYYMYIHDVVGTLFFFLSGAAEREALPLWALLIAANGFPMFKYLVFAHCVKEMYIHANLCICPWFLLVKEVEQTKVSHWGKAYIANPLSLEAKAFGALLIRHGVFAAKMNSIYNAANEIAHGTRLIHTDRRILPTERKDLQRAIEGCGGGGEHAKHMAFFHYLVKLHGEEPKYSQGAQLELGLVKCLIRMNRNWGTTFDGGFDEHVPLAWLMFKGIDIGSLKLPFEVKDNDPDVPSAGDAPLYHLFNGWGQGGFTPSQCYGKMMGTIKRQTSDAPAPATDTVVPQDPGRPNRNAASGGSAQTFRPLADAGSGRGQQQNRGAVGGGGGVDQAVRPLGHGSKKNQVPAASGGTGQVARLLQEEEEENVTARKKRKHESSDDDDASSNKKAQGQKKGRK